MSRLGNGKWNLTWGSCLALLAVLGIIVAGFLAFIFTAAWIAIKQVIP